MSPSPQRPAAASPPGGHRQRPGTAGSAAVAWSLCVRVATSVALVGFVAMPAQAQLFADDDARKAIIDLRAKLAASEEQARTRNAENVLILRGNPAVQRAYLDNWRRHRAEALSYAEAIAPD